MTTLNLNIPPRIMENQPDFLLNSFEVYSERELVFVIFNSSEVKQNGLLARVISELNMNSCKAQVYELTDEFGIDHLKNAIRQERMSHPNLKIINLAGNDVSKAIKALNH